MKNLRIICRILLGLLFIFSGFVKGVDPIGTQYRIIDYYIAFHNNWAIPFALYQSFLMNLIEFALGVLLIFNVRIKLVSWLVLLMMVFFTIVTFNDAINNPVPDCGCFGDAIKLTNWQTFWKNVVIMFPVLIVFFGRNQTRPLFTIKSESIITLFTILIFLSFEVYNYRHLPVMDFSKWKVGTKLAPDNPKPVQYFLTYVNKETGEAKEYLSPNYPFNDSLWMSRWKYKSQRIVDPNPPGHGLIIEDKDRNNLTDAIIKNPEYQFVVIAYDLSLAKKKGFAKINDFYKKSYADGYSLVIITSTLPENIDKFRKENNIDENIEILFADDTSLQGIIRSNPGLMLLKKALVLGKWHWRDIPEYTDLKQKLIK